MKMSDMDEFTATEYKREVRTYTWSIIVVEKGSEDTGYEQVEVVPNSICSSDVYYWYLERFGCDLSYRLVQRINTTTTIVMS